MKSKNMVWKRAPSLRELREIKKKKKNQKRERLAALNYQEKQNEKKWVASSIIPIKIVFIFDFTHWLQIE